MLIERCGFIVFVSNPLSPVIFCIVEILGIYKKGLIESGIFVHEVIKVVISLLPL